MKTLMFSISHGPLSNVEKLRAYAAELDNTTVVVPLTRIPVDRPAMPTEAAGDLASPKTHLHKAAQAASLIKSEVTVLRSHGDPGHSRCRTWFANLARTDCHPMVQR